MWAGQCNGSQLFHLSIQIFTKPRPIFMIIYPFIYECSFNFCRRQSFLTNNTFRSLFFRFIINFHHLIEMRVFYVELILQLSEAVRGTLFELCLYLEDGCLKLIELVLRRKFSVIAIYFVRLWTKMQLFFYMVEICQSRKIIIVSWKNSGEFVYAIFDFILELFVNVETLDHFFLRFLLLMLSYYLVSLDQPPFLIF